MRVNEVWVHIERVAAVLDGLTIVMLVVIGSVSKRSVCNRERIEVAGALHLLEGVLNASKHRQEDPIPGMGSRVTRVEFDGAAEFLLRAGGVPIVGERRPGNGVVGFGESVIDLHGF